ncbi:hypothetical protein ACHQM5_027142 [Ranunculus cassubicifolius]
MGRRTREREREIHKSQTLPPSPSHSFSSSSSSDFEFTITLSPKKTSPQHLCPADELFYKGQLLPLQLSPRLSMVRTLLLASPSSSSSDTTTASRDSTGSSSSFGSELGLLGTELDSARQSSVTEEEQVHQIKKPSTSNKYFSLSRFSNVFKAKTRETDKNAKKICSTKEVIRKYLKKVKPLYDKLSSQKPKLTKIDCSVSVSDPPKSNNGGFQNSFSGNLKYPRRRRCVSSCPSSMRSSPTHPYSLLPRTSLVTAKSIGSSTATTPHCSELSSMEELQSAIQGAIAHCKNSMIQSTTSTWVSKEI